MIDLRFVPVEHWPGQKTPSAQRKDGRFRVSYAGILDDLEIELIRLKATSIIVQAYFVREDIRNDGWPRSHAEPTEPGVILSFTSKAGNLSYPCDTYHTYDDNLRAISLTLAALRAIDRYGVSQHGEQYKGWLKLPPAPDKMTKEDAFQFFGLYSHTKIVDADTLKAAYREAARVLHPDSGAPSQHFIMLGQAQTALKEAYGW